jgi:hypothetical protein
VRLPQEVLTARPGERIEYHVEATEVELTDRLSTSSGSALAAAVDSTTSSPNSGADSPGELCGLLWSDVDLEARTVTVRHRVVLGPDGYRHEDGTKSDHSARTIDLDERTVALRRTHRVAQTEARLLAGPAWDGLGVVFADERGRWLSPPGVTQTFKRAVRKIDVPPLALHGYARHTHASLRVPMHVVSRRLGHASEAFTAAVYAHVLPASSARQRRRSRASCSALRTADRDRLSHGRHTGRPCDAGGPERKQPLTCGSGLVPPTGFEPASPP